ncbi:hypothetical protein [Ferrimonas marina]|uniref:Uncharacterized protein n=1 Tax=Ferrimonas marina TaxID=299255 RepID=A0A1M5TBW2_9GAMM|nr:hypothetical protein [Ferrimonas marina]SHH48171.1 hypothetical protein SAMN02745129_2075 [Ferrimonas marina]
MSEIELIFDDDMDLPEEELDPEVEERGIQTTNEQQCLFALREVYPLISALRPAEINDQGIGRIFQHYADGCQVVAHCLTLDRAPSSTPGLSHALASTVASLHTAGITDDLPMFERALMVACQQIKDYYEQGDAGPFRELQHITDSGPFNELSVTASLLPILANAGLKQDVRTLSLFTDLIVRGLQLLIRGHFANSHGHKEVIPQLIPAVGALALTLIKQNDDGASHEADLIDEMEMRLDYCVQLATMVVDLERRYNTDRL